MEEQRRFIFAGAGSYKPINQPIPGIDYNQENKSWAEQGGTIRGEKSIGCGINTLLYLDVIDRNQGEQMVSSLQVNRGVGTSFVDMLNSIRLKYNSPPLYELRTELGFPVSTDSLSNFFLFILNNYPDRALIMIKLNRDNPLFPLGHSVVLHKVGRSVWTLDPQQMTERKSFDLDDPLNATNLSKIANVFSNNRFNSISVGYFKNSEVHNLQSVAITLPKINMPHSDSDSDSDSLDSDLDSLDSDDLFPGESKAESKAEAPEDAMKKYLEKYQNLLSKDKYSSLISNSKNIENMTSDVVLLIDDILDEYRERVMNDRHLIRYAKELKNIYDTTGEIAVYDEDKINDIQSLCKYMRELSKKSLDKYNVLLEGLNNNKNELQINMKSLSIAINDIGHIDAPWKQSMLSKLDNLRIHITSDIQKIDGAINEFNIGRNEIDAKATELLNDIVHYMLDMDIDNL